MRHIHYTPNTSSIGPGYWANPSPITGYVAAFGIIFSIAHSICNRIKFK